MSSGLTKKELEEVLDVKFGQYQASIAEALDFRFQKLDKRMESFEIRLEKLTVTLDNFLKRITDYDDEMKLLKADIDKIKVVLKDKLGVEIAL